MSSGSLLPSQEKTWSTTQVYDVCCCRFDLENCLNLFDRLWANNGDALSRQYAGTNALKGDFTRTGERNLSGLMKDGVNSASRLISMDFSYLVILMG